MSAKQAINDKLQGSVATYFLFCGGIVNNQIKKGLLHMPCISGSQHSSCVQALTKDISTPADMEPRH